MHEQIWTFTRGIEELRVRRSTGDARFLLTIEGVGDPRTYEFPKLPRLQRFQEDFEAFLVGTGWTFVRFAPDRRSGRERRHFTRLMTDRRRWWTDGLPAGRTDTAVDAPGDQEPLRPRRRGRARTRP